MGSDIIHEFISPVYSHVSIVKSLKPDNTILSTPEKSKERGKIHLLSDQFMIGRLVMSCPLYSTISIRPVRIPSSGTEILPESVILDNNHIHSN
jgi:hypothetical protein